MGKKALFIGGILIILIVLQKKFKSVPTCESAISYDTVDINEHLDPKELFSPITQLEKQEILRAWEKIDLSPRDVVELYAGTLTYQSKTYTLSHTVEHNTHYGAIFTPMQMVDSMAYPVLVFAGGLDQRHPAVHLNHNVLRYLLERLGQQFIIVVPSFRGQALNSSYYTYCSEGFFGDAFDGAATDAIALLKVALAKFPQADSNRVAAYGASRGGTVALLMGIRNRSVKKVIAQAAPTNFFSAWMKLRYGKQYKYQFLSEELPLDEIRKKIIRSSPVHFVEYLPELWLEHGRDDGTVEPEQAGMLRDSLWKKGKGPTSRINIIPGRGHEMWLEAEHIAWLAEWQPEAR